MAGSAPGRIPWTAVVTWCEVHGLPEDDLDFLWRCFAAMDEVFIRVQVEQIRQATRSAGGGQGEP
jgi:hypothetical protein